VNNQQHYDLHCGDTDGLEVIYQSQRYFCFSVRGIERKNLYRQPFQPSIMVLGAKPGSEPLKAGRL
jgi:hypothetical protein